MLSKNLLNKYTLDFQRIVVTIVILSSLTVIAAVLSGGVFLKPGNILNLLNQNVLLGVVALGQFLVILTGGIDLSVGSIVGLSSVMLVQYHDLGFPAALILTVLVAAFLGFVNGSLVTFRRLPPFVVTLGMMLIALSLAQIISGGAAVYTGIKGTELSSILTSFYGKSILHVPYPALLWMTLLLLIKLYLKTSYGHYTYASGGNEVSAFLSGLPVKMVKISAYIISSVMASIGGILSVARVGIGHPQAGQWYILDSIAAVTIGGASLSGGIGTVIGTLLGVIILGTINNILNLLRVSPMLQPAAKGLVILLAVYLNTIQKKKGKE